MSAATVVDRTGREQSRHLHVVDAPRARHTLRYALLAILLAAGTVFGAVALNALAAGEAVTARQLEQEVAAAERHYEELTIEVARLEDPARIRRAALDLGMVPARSPRYLHPERPLPGDGGEPEVVEAGDTTDPLKPVLSVQR